MNSQNMQQNPFKTHSNQSVNQHEEMEKYTKQRELLKNCDCYEAVLSSIVDDSLQKHFELASRMSFWSNKRK